MGGWAGGCVRACVRAGVCGRARVQARTCTHAHTRALKIRLVNVELKREAKTSQHRMKKGSKDQSTQTQESKNTNSRASPRIPKKNQSTQTRDSHYTATGKQKKNRHDDKITKMNLNTQLGSQLGIGIDERMPKDPLSDRQDPFFLSRTVHL